MKINTNMNTQFLYFFLLILLGSCSIKPTDTEKAETAAEGCLNPAYAADLKTQLENGMRGKVKFIGETETLSSISDKMSEYIIPAMSLAVIKEGQIEWSETYQNAELAGNQRLDCISIFQAASLSKPVTFMAALRMHAAGEIDLDKNIRDYLRSFQLPKGKQTIDNPVTFRNLFSHTSGINGGGYQGYNRNIDMPSDVDILMGNDGVNSAAIEVVWSPNQTLVYSGGGYTLAELALQDIYGTDFSEIMKKWILNPANMKNSEFTQPLPASYSDRVAKGHTQSGEPLEGGWRNHPEQAAAGLWSNARDLAKFMTEIYNAYQGKPSIFSQSDVKSMIRDEREGHIYGFIVNRTDDDLAITHYGGNAGYRTAMTISLTTGNGLVYLINSDNGGNLGNEILLSAAQVYGWKQFEQNQLHRKEIDTEILKTLMGEFKWNDQINLNMRYDEKEKLIALNFPNGDEYKLVHVIGDELDFVHPNTGIEVSFLQEDNFNSFSLYGQKAVRQ
ncbi:serine hydrolase domain-containing protein [Marivirga arenosa]|uniref:Serine hydrolase domain-containing protein n=1 Tax=Marivirga arenosa TaxID=3059076 RepID=A0AA51ZWM2_9BACT|nr:serine hydrolase domain-containing protein [Marivirga sp. BKB1-2]WNB18100.1 serine hydrolase domain-containing protein [Marivirga sp. BKB1-2]